MNLQKHSVEILAIGGALLTTMVAEQMLIICKGKKTPSLKILNRLKYVYTSILAVKITARSMSKSLNLANSGRK